ncbi:hypothetical protein XENTR_v10017124 [Xenopus tropicalis]|nr:F-box only protein 43 [Xenopus tropicalis]KAE8599271.1 hypothetical protein XENTR_v10017124 [Xenopus tropicalis]KAE8599272.1 hypothetical protein XENTR_v10017124 [Xenopus tropicalis]KAE8599273.1 hypothetical protein XENTR_v10017124 [Xenopus tropicalis]KAE8599274.1 hypothetical protein XENTR_v10017124 [Xenopus tropicalis]
MAQRCSLLDNFALHHSTDPTGATKKVDRQDHSISVSQDSGYSDSLKGFSPDSHKSGHFLETVTEGYENSENIDPTLILSPIKHEIPWGADTRESKQLAPIYETPRFSKKDFSLRRRLLISKATSGGNLDFDASVCSTESYGREKSLKSVPSFEGSLSNSFVDSPRDSSYKPIATSTLKTESESGTSCKKWRLSFAQQRSSTLDDSKSDSISLPEVENISPVQHSLTSSTDDSILYEENIFGAPTTPTCNLIAKEEFQTPISNLAANFSFNLCTPSITHVSDFEISVTEDSAFHSLSLDKSQDSITDHEGSFQELIQKPRVTPKAVHNKNRSRKLDRCRRLSTLRERGSQSEVEEEGNEAPLLSSAYKSKVARASVDEENEFSSDDSRVNSLLSIDDLTGKPALRVLHEMLLRSTRKRPQQATVQDLLGSSGCFELPEDSLSRLIGRKMGLVTFDILAELKYRNLKHIIASILGLMNVESICSMCRVSRDWRDIILQDKSAHQRRKAYMRRLKTEAEQGRQQSFEDSATTLNILSRSALKSVQIQARTAFQTPTSSLTPGDNKSIQSASKHQEYLKVAKTLFTDEALKPCPRCQFPAKYQALKKRGKCSRKDCGFDFCVLCLCTFHGSKECGTGSAKRIPKKEALPGSAQSKRNLKRL